MITLEPLKQWICDTCGELIAKTEDGWVEWTQDGSGRHSFRLVHHVSASPRAEPSRFHSGGCYGHSANRDHHLRTFLGELGMVKMLSLLDAGSLHMPEYRQQVADVRSWVDTFRRLFCPYYEEARQYFGRLTNGHDINSVHDYLGGANEVLTYEPQFLRDMCEHYRRLDG